MTDVAVVPLDLTACCRAWLAEHLPADGLVRAFAAAGRAARSHHHLASGDPWNWQPEDLLRAHLLLAAGSDAEPTELYRYGDAAERRGVLRGLELLDHPGREGAALVRQGLRENDPRLVAAALGPYGVSTLDDTEFGQALLKCLFVELDPTRIPGVEARMTDAAAAQVLDLALERVVAGRSLDRRVWPLVAGHLHPERVRRLRAELESPYPHRRQAARILLDDLDGTS